MAREPLVAELDERGPALLDLLVGNRPVDLVQVDGVEAEPGEAAFELAPEPVSRQVVERRPVGPFRLSALGEDVRPLVEARDRAPDDLFRVPEAVLGRGVDPVHPELERPMDGRDRFLVLLRAPAPLEAAAADRPGAEADTRDLHARRAEGGCAELGHAG